MRKQVNLLRPRRRIPFIPFAAPLELINDLSEVEGGEECGAFETEEFIDLIERAAAGDPDVEVGASPEIAQQLNEYAGREFTHTEKELI